MRAELRTVIVMIAWKKYLCKYLLYTVRSSEAMKKKSSLKTLNLIHEYASAFMGSFVELNFLNKTTLITELCVRFNEIQIA